MQNLIRLLAVGVLALAVLGCGHKGSKIAWAPTFASAVEQAKAKNQLVMVKFYADWCGPCHELEETTLSDPDVVQRMGQLSAFKADVDSPAGAKLAEKYKVSGIPAVVFMKPDGAELARFVGVVSVPEFLGFVKTASEKA